MEEAVTLPQPLPSVPPNLCWLLETSVLVLSVLRLIEQAFLSKYAAEKYHHYGFETNDFQPFGLFGGRRGSVGVSSGHYHQATSLSQLSRAPKTFSVLGQTSDDFPSARHAG